MLGLEYTAGELVDNLRTSAPAGLVDGLLNALPGAAFALLLGWNWVTAVVLAGVTWVSSSGVIAKILADLGRLGNRETPVILSVLVIEDLAMAFYLPLVTAVLAGASLVTGGKALAIAVVTVVAVLLVAIRFGHVISKAISVKDPEALLLVVFGLTLLVAGVAGKLKVSAAVGAFLVGIAISGPVAHHAAQLLTPLRDLFAAAFFVFFGLATDPRDIPPVILPALALAVVTMATKVVTGYLAARRAGIALRRPPACRPRPHAARRVLDRHRWARRRKRRRRSAARPARHRVRADHGRGRIGARAAARHRLVQAPAAPPRATRRPRAGARRPVG